MLRCINKPIENYSACVRERFIVRPIAHWQNKIIQALRIEQEILSNKLQVTLRYHYND